MLTIGAISQPEPRTSVYQPERRKLVWFVADENGEWVFSTAGAVTLAAIGRTGGVFVGSRAAAYAGFNRCEEFVEQRGEEAELSLCIADQLALQESSDLQSMWRS